MVFGPVTFVPRVAEEVLERRSAIPLAENEGLYVRNTKSGKVRASSGRAQSLGYVLRHIFL